MTLKEAIERSELINGDEFTAIRMFADDNDKLPQIIDLLIELVKTNSHKMQNELQIAKEYLRSPTSYYYKEYPYEVAANLDYLTRKMQLGYEFDDEDKKIMLGIELPEQGLFWRDLADAIRAVQEEYKRKKNKGKCYAWYVE